MAPPAIAEAVFGPTLHRARCYVGLLATVAVERGLIGPRETDRLWERHLCNCAVLTELLPRGARIVDVGSGAGLPGLALVLRRPDLRVDLVDAQQRRVDFLTEAVAELGLEPTVRVVRGRAEDVAVARAVGGADWVTARAVAPLDRLVRWCLPLLRPGGQLLALKGERAADEVATHARSIKEAGGRDVRLRSCGEGLLAQPVTVVQVRRRASVPTGQWPSGQSPSGRRKERRD